MTTLEYVAGVALPSALTLLPGEMDTPEARAMLIAICLQESGLRHRQQVGGPAMGFAQFERAGIEGVLTHPASRDPIMSAITTLRYPAEVGDCYRGVRDNDVLALCFARCLLWTLPDALPKRLEPEIAWHQYIAAWRPGKPRPEKWPANLAQGWACVEE